MVGCLVPWQDRREIMFYSGEERLPNTSQMALLQGKDRKLRWESHTGIP